MACSFSMKGTSLGTSCAMGLRRRLVSSSASFERFGDKSLSVGEGGWAELTEPIIVRAGEAFVAVPEHPT